MIVGARRRRAEVGVCVKINVVLYALDFEQQRWGFTLCDARQRPIVRSAPHAERRTETFEAAVDELALLLDVRIVREGSRLLRDDERWDVSVRTPHVERDELPFRVS